MNEKNLIKESIYKYSPIISNSIVWNLINSALLIKFTPKNTGDLFIDIRKKYGFKGGNKTHNDVTSGSDIGQGLSPADDFFVVPKGKSRVQVYIHQVNIKRPIGSKSDNWLPQMITVNKRDPRNDSRNPSIQLLEKNDLFQIRNSQTIGDGLIFLKQNNGEIFVIGLKFNDELSSIIGAKSKRMFYFSENFEFKDISPYDNEDEITYKINDNFDKESQIFSTGYKQGRTTNPKLNSAIEKHGMNLCEKFFINEGFNVYDVSEPKLANAMGLEEFPGFDQLATKDLIKMGVEVKSTTTPGMEINISSNEIRSAISKDIWRLCVVKNIKIINSEELELQGGEISIYKLIKKNELKSYLEKMNESIFSMKRKGLNINLSFSFNISSVFLEKENFKFP